MKIDEIKSTLEAYNNKFEKTSKIAQHCLEQIQTQKIKSKLAPLLWQRIFELALHSAAGLALLIFLSKNASHFGYAASAILLVVFYAVAAVNCVKQINIMARINRSSNISVIKTSLHGLETKIRNAASLAVLFLPAFLGFPAVVSKAVVDFNISAFSQFDIIAMSGGTWWTAQLISFIALVPVGIWQYLSTKNKQAAGSKNFLTKTLGKRVARARQFANELETLNYGAI